MTAASIGFDGTRWLATDREAVWQPARIVAVQRNRSATTIRLRLAEPPDVLPGQYYLVRVAIDRPPGAVQQAYSLSSSPYPRTPEMEIVVRAVPGGRASPVLARQVEVGDDLQVRGPFGFLTWTEHDEGPVGLVGAGTGVAPLASIVRYASARGLQVPMTLLCSSRDRTEALLGAELKRLSHRQRWFRLVHTFTRSPEDPFADFHRRVDATMLQAVMGSGPGPGGLRPRSFYVAGPFAFVQSMRDVLGDLDVPDSRIYSEDHA